MSPDLPPEIENQIFKCAARMHPKYAPTLSVISKRVQECVERVIYEKLHFFPVQSQLPWPRSAEVATIQLFKFTLHHRPAEFFATHVRSVIFQNNVLYRSAKLVLEKCTGLEHLCFFISPQPPQVSDATPLIFPSAYTLQSLMTTRNVLKDMADSGIVCPRLRYLWIDGPYTIRIPALPWLPAVHTVDFLLYKQPLVEDSWKDDARTVMSTAQNLQILGLYVYEGALGHVDRWKETVESPIKIKTRVHILFSDSLLERWRILTTSVTDVLLED